MAKDLKGRELGKGLSQLACPQPLRLTHGFIIGTTT